MEAHRSTQEHAGHGEKLSRSKERAIAALMLKATIRQAAEECGVHESTLRRWLAEPEFAKAYERARSQVLQATGTLLRNKALAAVLVLGEIMASDQSKPMTRVAAARGVLEFCFRSVEMDGLQEIRETLVRVEDKLDRRKR